jgi:uncharacterized membrane protein YhaH (DUF805 family)|tara:strand:+ start:73 stop:438 length:366 start_codon:yes stop_codon:yes gene_type:complete
MDWYLKVLKQYADFNGRARRKEYWMFFLFNMVFAVLASLIDFSAGTANFVSGSGLFQNIYSLVVFVPGLAVGVRRLHDVGKSGWMLLLAFIPLIGAIWLLVLFATNSKEGTNKWGQNPKEV